MLLIVIFVGCTNDFSDNKAKRAEELLNKNGIKYNLSDELYGIDFRTIDRYTLYNNIEKLNEEYYIDDCEGNNIQKVIENTLKQGYQYCVTMKKYIGNGLDERYIQKVHYEYISTRDSIYIEIKFDIDYWEVLYSDLISRYGYENAYIRIRENYEVSWTSTIGHNQQKGIYYIKLYKEDQHEDEKPLSCFLVIETIGEYEH